MGTLLNLDLATASEITRTGLTAHAARATVHATNLANVETTDTASGGPFKPLQVALSTTQTVAGGRGVAATTTESSEAPLGRPDPAHPHADADGWVWLPPIDVTRETTSLATARRAYEANLAAARAVKRMNEAALDMAR